MKVFKFGGVSIKDAAAINNICGIIQRHASEQLLIVVSAMGETTNIFEGIVKDIASGRDAKKKVALIFDYHYAIVEELFKYRGDFALDGLKKLFGDLENDMSRTYSSYGEQYDCIVSYGEIISSWIISHFVASQNLGCKLVDARKFIKTNTDHREAKVNWEATCQLIVKELPEIIYKDIIITQGFIASSLFGTTTTLGREGSDFSAAIFGHCLQAASVVVWKDVPGILNADPKIISNTVKFNELSYNEAAEMTYYGANVIHPQTIKPLANKNIPLWVRSFEDLSDPGTCIHDCFVDKPIPSLIFKENQSLISFQVKDFTFIDEKNLMMIFDSLQGLNIKVNVMQSSAISFSICIDNQDDKIAKLINQLKNNFKILYNENLQLITVKNYDDRAINFVSANKIILLEQKSRHNYQIVVQKD